MQLINNEHLIIGNDCKNIIDFADNLNELITKFDPEIATVIDVTSISHELLCILIALLNQHNKLNKTVLFYTGAKQYSINTPANAMWLSKGVASIRSILGYPGTMLTSKPLHLVLMAGFEVERAFEVIRSYEPNLLSLGLGDSEHSVSKEHYENNVVFLIGYKNLSRNKN
jgi:hypothetical protein